MILREPPVWNEAAAELLKQFLDSGAGTLFLAHLAAHRPALATNTSDVNAVALQASVVAGYERAITNILSLAEPPTKEGDAEETYPHLDDDSKWKSEPPK